MRVGQLCSTAWILVRMGWFQSRAVESRHKWWVMEHSPKCTHPHNLHLVLHRESSGCFSLSSVSLPFSTQASSLMLCLQSISSDIYRNGRSTHFIEATILNSVTYYPLLKKTRLSYDPQYSGKVWSTSSIHKLKLSKLSEAQEVPWPKTFPFAIIAYSPLSWVHISYSSHQLKTERLMMLEVSQQY
jgi:hypothetical protein